MKKPHLEKYEIVGSLIGIAFMLGLVFGLLIGKQSISPKIGGAPQAPGLPSQAWVQEEINRIFIEHGQEPIKVDGVIGAETRAAWDMALCYVKGDEIYKGEME
jgi:hypothetical protein